MSTLEASRPAGVEHDAEAIIRQARRRQRRRRWYAGAAAVFALAGAVGGYAAASGSGRLAGNHPRPRATTSDLAHPPPSGSAGLGVDSTLLMWPIGYPFFGLNSGPPAYIGSLEARHLARRQIPQITGCDCLPYLIGVGRWLVYTGDKGTMAISASLTGTPRVLGANGAFAASVTPGRVWLVHSRPHAVAVRSVPVAGGPPGPAITLPNGTRLARGTDAGMLLERPNGVFEMWKPGEKPARLPRSATELNAFAVSARMVAYGTGCSFRRPLLRRLGDEAIGYQSCENLRVFNVVTGRLESFHAPPGTAGWIPQYSQIGEDETLSPRNTMIAAEAVTSPRLHRGRLYVIRLTGRRRRAEAVPSSTASMYARAAWSADGSWLFYQGPGAHLWAYRVTTGQTRPSMTPCCRYNVMVTLPNHR